MKPLVPYSDALLIDRRVKETYRLSDDMLMEAAAIGMASILESDACLRRSLYSFSLPALAVCGSGNNGGDALAILRRLSFNGMRNLVAIAPRSPGETTARRLTEATLSGVRMLSAEDSRAAEAVKEAGIVLDGATGVGFKGTMRPELARLIDLCYQAIGPVVAIDVPSGIGGLIDTRSDQQRPVKAAVSLSINPLKAELFYQGYRRYAGRILPITGVFPVTAGNNSKLSLLEADDLYSFLPGLDPDSHKGDRGALAMFAGCPESTGAAVLCARGASAAGAGSVTLLVQKEIQAILSGILVSQMVRPATNPGTRRFDAVVAGPGWGIDNENGSKLDELWEAALPLVLDADALRLLATRRRPLRCSPLMLTPHPGEFAALAAIACGADPQDSMAFTEAARVAAMRASFDTATIVVETARHFGAVVILKGSVSWIGDPDGRLAVWDGRDPGLASAGSGDVLAGLAGGFLARGASSWDAAIAAVMTHALAARSAAIQGFYEAGDLIAPAAALARERSLHGNKG